jgi:hypothetical protein
MGGNDIGQKVLYWSVFEKDFVEPRSLDKKIRQPP